MKRVIVFTPFKTGSTSICVSLQKAGHGFAKIHTETELAALDLSEYDALITCSRKQSEIYASAFFHDICSRDVPYYYGTRQQVLEATPEQLLRHFSRFDWTSFQWLNFEHHAEAIRKRTGIDPTLRFGQCVSVFRSSACPVISFRTDRLDDCFDTGCLLAGLGRIPLSGHENVGTDKWYSEKYHQFLNLFRTVKNK